MDKKTLYECTVADNLNKKYFGYNAVDAEDIKTPYTLIGVKITDSYDSGDPIILRGYKIKSLIVRYLKIKGANYKFYIVSKEDGCFEFEVKFDYVCHQNLLR